MKSNKIKHFPIQYIELENDVYVINNCILGNIQIEKVKQQYMVYFHNPNYKMYMLDPKFTISEQKEPVYKNLKSVILAIQKMADDVLQQSIYFIDSKQKYELFE